MEYLISRNNVRAAIKRHNNIDGAIFESSIPKFLDDLFKSKQPVKLLADGEFSDDWIIENDKLIMGSDITRKIYDLGFEGKRVQVLLSEVAK